MPRWVEMHLQLCFSKMVYGSEKKEMRPLAAKIRFPITGSGRGQPWEHHFLFSCFRQLEFFPPSSALFGFRDFLFQPFHSWVRNQESEALETSLWSHFIMVLDELTEKQVWLWWHLLCVWGNFRPNTCPHCYPRLFIWTLAGNNTGSFLLMWMYWPKYILLIFFMEAVNLQCFICLKCTTKWFSYIYMCIYIILHIL